VVQSAAGTWSSRVRRCSPKRPRRRYVGGFAECRRCGSDAVHGVMQSTSKRRGSTARWRLQLWRAPAGGVGPAARRIDGGPVGSAGARVRLPSQLTMIAMAMRRAKSSPMTAGMRRYLYAHVPQTRDAEARLTAAWFARSGDARSACRRHTAPMTNVPPATARRPGFSQTACPSSIARDHMRPKIREPHRSQEADPGVQSGWLWACRLGPLALPTVGSRLPPVGRIATHTQSDSCGRQWSPRRLTVGK
jgi:hypothetical protein